MYLHEMLGIFHTRYNRRNRLCFPGGLHELIRLFNKKKADLNRSLREDDPPEMISRRLIDVTGWLCAVVNYFDELPFIEAFTMKYGESRCPYCGKTSCGCDPNVRPESPKISFKEMGVAGCGRTIDWWCEHLETIFGKRNQEAGIYRVISHLNEEMEEVIELTGVIAFVPNDLDELERQYALELSDVFAHLIAIANLKEINLTAVLQDRYGESCPTCREKSCLCPRVIVTDEEIRKIGTD